MAEDDPDAMIAWCSERHQHDDPHTDTARLDSLRTGEAAGICGEQVPGHSGQGPASLISDALGQTDRWARGIHLHRFRRVQVRYATSAVRGAQRRPRRRFRPVIFLDIYALMTLAKTRESHHGGAVPTVSDAGKGLA